MKFRELNIGQTFDWINDDKPGFNSFFCRCTKTGVRSYARFDGQRHRVGSINAEVYHVNPVDGAAELASWLN